MPTRMWPKNPKRPSIADQGEVDNSLPPDRVVLSASILYDLYLRCRPLITTILAADFELLAVGPPEPRAAALEEMGCNVVTQQFDRKGSNLLSEVRSLIGFTLTYLRYRPLLVHSFTIKPNLYGIIAARIARVPVVIASVNGLGFLWTENTYRVRFLRATVGRLYQLVLSWADAVVYHNEDDRALMKGKITLVVPGAGVDVHDFSSDRVSNERREALKAELGLGGKVVVLMVARMLRHKGVTEFVEAAAQVRKRYPEAEFVLVGPIDSGNPSMIPADVLLKWDATGVIRWLGQRDDIRDLMAIADIVVLPTYYREGLPRVLIEAAAMGRPLVATDAPGCRDVVKHGVNGFLVPPRDSGALAESIEKLLENPEQRARFGAASRSLAVRNLSDQKVTRLLVDLYKELLMAKGYTAASNKLTFRSQ